MAVALPALAEAGVGVPVKGGGICKGKTSYVTVCAKEPSRGGGGSTSGGKPAGQGKGAGKGKGKAGPAVCAVERLDPQPPASDPLWKGHKPGDGAIYARVCLDDVLGIAAGGVAGGAPQMFWAAQAPEVNVDPEQLARQAVDSMLLTGPDIASPRTAGKYTVGVPMWMWVTPSPTTFGPNTASASLAGLTVSATAKVSSIRWSMGDGRTVTCDGAGTAYKASYGMAKSPTCGHFYRSSSKDRAGGRFKGTAVATWAVQWHVTGGGETGEFTETRESDLAVSVGEMRVLD
ncbi:ATP/GTP-binding protein [Streptomyces flavofungini]|uniref:ATP/GTP-binding protein n=1 Tax=Streptomyces flavofungini TaxID=68200 RepID=UPI001E4317AD|nr:ATP/GTP-binding protein [Streptomyces flavofungini]